MLPKRVLLFSQQLLQQLPLNALLKKYHSLYSEVLVILGTGLFAQMTMWFPNWLVVFLLVEAVAAWSLLEEMGVVELLETQAQSMESSLVKFWELIPRHKGE